MSPVQRPRGPEASRKIAVAGVSGRAGLSKIGPFVPRCMQATAAMTAGSETWRDRVPALFVSSCIREPTCRVRASTGSEPLHVSLVAIPEAVVSTLSGIFDVMNAFAMMPSATHRPHAPPFRVEIVGLKPGPLELASRVPDHGAAQFRRHSMRPTSSSCPRSCSDRTAGGRTGIRNWSTGFAPCIAAARFSARPARAFSCSPKPGSSTAWMRRCILATPAPSRTPIRRCRSTRSACWSSPASARN